jgi:exodeoxyribonuclease VII large subunit
MSSCHPAKSVEEPSLGFNPTGEALSVSQIVGVIKNQLESRFPNLLIEGEISNFKRQASGHCYFSLKDASSQISAVMFRGHASRLRQLPKEGDHVVVQGAINIYAPRGQMQLMVREMSLVGVGQMLERLEQLKAELAKLGWFDRKRPLPKAPGRIGVVTSPTGAAIQDMLNILSRRHGGFHLILDPVRVQGAEAPGEIAAAIRRFNQYRLADVLIVGRGGGSIEDLWAFNERVVAQAIFESEIPIISAVGHETDHCLADLVADLRAPTPSAAAELVTAERDQQIAFLITSSRRLQQTMRHLLARTRARLERFRAHPLLVSPYALLGRAMQRLDELRQGLGRAIQGQLSRSRLRLQGYQARLRSVSPLTRITQCRTQLARLVAHLQSLDPRNVLKKGYSILFEEKGKRVIRSVKELQPGDRLRARLADGEVHVETK